MNKEQDIIQSWQANAGNWIQIIEDGGIPSRKLATNKAIIEAVCADKPASVFDIGCGEGWLAKELAERGIAVTGADIIPALIESAKEKIKGNFVVASYEDIAEQRSSITDTFDVIVINFALIGKESTEQLLASLPGYLSPGGKLFIQTLHPHSRKQMDDYTSGWKPGSWDGLGDQFIQSYQWYFRTLEDWLELLNRVGFSRISFTEPVHPQTRQPLSVIFRCRV
ncbi:MAG: class I SAM-dependent methyltransferase [Chitinophagaceae bacterium]|nr:class I SAM-dependent methyltransferase [Chitinophagaceae bacterium]